jgi:hypothetical protein
VVLPGHRAPDHGAAIAPPGMLQPAPLTFCISNYRPIARRLTSVARRFLCGFGGSVSSRRLDCALMAPRFWLANEPDLTPNPFMEV